MKKTTNAAANGDFNKIIVLTKRPARLAGQNPYPDAIEYTTGPVYAGLDVIHGFLGLVAMLVPGIFGVIYPDEPDWLDYVTGLLCTLIGLGFPCCFLFGFEFFRRRTSPTILTVRIARSPGFGREFWASKV